MKTRVSASSQSGSILVVALITTSVIALVLAGYMTMTSTQYRNTLRSQSWNAVMPVVEAGIEEALTHMNKNCITDTVINQPVNFTGDGWQEIATSIYQKSSTIGDSSYTVTIIFTNVLKPEIVSEGFVSPFNVAKSKLIQFATLNNGAAPVGRKVKVTAGRDCLIAKAMFAKGLIDINGKNVQTDSFDSTDPNYSTGGVYDPFKKKDKGDIATNADLIDSVNIGNAKIYGHVSTGPGGTIAIGPLGSVGDRAWVEGGTLGIQPGRSTDDMNVYIPEVVLPFTSPTASPLRDITLTNPVVTWLFQTNSYTSYSDALAASTNGWTIATNSVISTNGSYPASGTFLGSVYVNTRKTTNATYPSPGTYQGIVTTNITSTNDPVYPSNPYGGTVATNTTPTDSVTYPIAGTFVGAVSTNFTYRDNKKDPPASGTYVPGSLIVTTNGNNVRYRYQEINGYSYNAISSYFYQIIRDYTYNEIIGYTFNLITDYSLIGSAATTNMVIKTYDYVFDTGDYEVDSLTGDVLVRGNARVHVTQTLSFSGTDQLEINMGASLKLYVSAEKASMMGNGVMNYTGRAENMYYYGLPSNTELKMNGNGGFTGVIYAPQAAFTLGGGGSNKMDFVGASVTKTVDMNGHFHFHYDESLEGSGPARGYLITTWNEIMD